MSRRKIPNEALDKLLGIVQKRFPKLEAQEVDVVAAFAWDGEAEDEWSIAGHGDVSVLAGRPVGGVVAGVQRSSSLDREGDVLLVVRFR